MRRRHLFEFEDLDWFPKALRNMVTDFLHEALVARRRFYAPAAPLLARVLKETGDSRIVDLCSGGSGPWPQLKPELEHLTGPVRLTLTDKFPNVPAFESAVTRLADGRTSFEGRSVDASKTPEDITGVRTLFTSFHHFAPQDATDLLRDAYRGRHPICVFEHTERTWPAVFLTVLFTPFLFAGHTLRHRPLTVARVLFTFLFPVLPMVAAWDGAISNLRTHTPEEMRTMIADFDSDDYVWEVGIAEGQAPAPPVTYLLGRPT